MLLGEGTKGSADLNQMVKASNHDTYSRCCPSMPQRLCPRACARDHKRSGDSRWRYVVAEGTVKKKQRGPGDGSAAGYGVA